MGAVIDRFATAGVRFDLLPGDRLLAHGDLTDELRDAIRTHKPAILQPDQPVLDLRQFEHLRDLRKDVDQTAPVLAVSSAGLHLPVDAAQLHPDTFEPV